MDLEHYIGFFINSVNWQKPWLAIFSSLRRRQLEQAQELGEQDHRREDEGGSLTGCQLAFLLQLVGSGGFNKNNWSSMLKLSS